MGDSNKSLTRNVTLGYAYRTVENSTRPDVYFPRNITNWAYPVNDTFTEYRNGWKLPGWRNRIRVGETATTSMTGYKVHCRATPGYAWYTYKRLESGPDAVTTIDRSTWGHFCYLQRPSIVFPDITALDEKALAQFRSRAKDAQISFGSGVYLGEMRETVKMLTHGARGVAQGIYRYLDKAKKLAKVRKRGRTLGKSVSELNKSLTGHYLEFTYGITPLVNDVQTAAGALAKLQFDPPEKRVVSGSASMTTVSQEVGNQTINYGLKINWSSVLIADILVRYRGAMKLRTEGVDGVLETLGLTPSDFLPTVWALLPWSFVLDWFVNVHELVDAVSFPYASLGWLQRTVLYRTRRVLTDSALDKTYIQNNLGPSVAGSFQCLWQGPSLEWETRFVTRDPWGIGAGDIPHLRFEIPGVKNWRRWANLSALTNQAALSRSYFLKP